MSVERLRDVIVIGAGPAGSTAARLLSEQGRDVLILEEHQEVGRPVHCTGLLGIAAFDEFALPRETILGIASSARFRSGDRSFLIEDDNVKAAVIDRAAFDRELSRRAVQAGATLATGARVVSVQPSDREVFVRIKGKSAPYRSRACVLACGANYGLHKQLGLGFPSAFLNSAQFEIGETAVDTVEVWLGRSFAPAGFAWTVPLTPGHPGRTRVGLMCEGDPRPHFERFRTLARERFRLDGQFVPTVRTKMLPLGPVGRTFGDRLIAIGDAAGLVKPTTGGGIYYALLSAKLGATALGTALTEDRLGVTDLRAFEHSWRATLGSELVAGQAFRRITSRIGDRAIRALLDLASTNGVVPLLKRNAIFNWHRSAAVALLGHSSFRRALQISE